MRRLSPEMLASYEALLVKLDGAIEAKDIDNARLYTYEAQQFLTEHGRKTLFDHIKEFLFAIVFALVIAALVRQMWFELYEIPTGSMRPTFLEADRVLAFKDSYCINIPFKTDHFYFQPELVHRGSIVVITGDKLDLPDVDTTYFGLFPGKRRYVKRCIAKDGDTVYFYGGKVYGIDKEGKELNSLLTSEYFKELTHIPFITFEGKVKKEKGKDSFTIRQMNVPIAKVEILPNGGVRSEVISKQKHETFGDFWGIHNYAMCRLLSPDTLPLKAYTLGYKRDDAKLYMEIKHNPELASNRTRARSNQSALLETHTTWLALDDAHLESIKQALYTARFYVIKGAAFRYTPEGPDMQGQGVQLRRNIPDGCYEFINGKAFEITFGSIQRELEPAHPLYPQGPELLKTLFNCGIEFSPITNIGKENGYFPARYAYFNNGVFCSLSKELFAKNDPLLEWFLQKELNRENQERGYKAFRDFGPPTKDGQIDVEFIRSYGFHVPENHYLLLGDNPAMSNDSRFFGPVPQENLQGSPSLIFWPPGPRLGRPPQPPLTFFCFSNIVVLILVGVVSSLSIWIIWRKTNEGKKYLNGKVKR